MKYPNFENEKELSHLGYKRICGIDEAGRGSWAGPVVAGAAVLPDVFKLDGLKDSKLLTSKKRDELFEVLIHKVDHGVGIVDNQKIDEIGILKATRLAMFQALSNLSSKPDFALLDAMRVGNLPCKQRYIVHGDLKVVSIAAASVIAKVTRDRILNELGKKKEFLRYGFAKHKGYGTKLHHEAILKYGICSLHRISYKPIAMLKQRCYNIN